ncbi:MAG: NifU family protein, partial [Bacteroidetes bacterium]
MNQEYEILLAKVNLALEVIKPYLAKDEGDLRVVEITADKIVKIELLGTCETCPMSAMTLKAGIEQAVLKAVPEIKA